MNIREKIQKQEEETLSPLASLSSKSQGRRLYEAEDSVRTCYMRDRDRIVHSKAFRRLKHKTQVYISTDNDHYRTRLTHTLEVNQIAKTIGRALNLNCDLIEAIALAHDVGHTPFAHCGEQVLNECLPNGFKHNFNSIRVLSYIEQHGKSRGLNLTNEVLNGVVHHSGFGKIKKCAYTLEGQIIRFSDKIAYVQHDIDDSIRAGVLKEEDLPSKYTEILGHSLSERITVLVNDLIRQGEKLESDSKEKILNFSPEINKALIGLREFMFSEIYKGPICSFERERASYIVEFLYNYFIKHIEKMPTFYQQIATTENEFQAVSDYISGMTDNYCIDLFKNLTIPRSFINNGNIFKEDNRVGG